MASSADPALADRATPPPSDPDGDDALGRRESKKRETRARIHRAAVELALERGTERVTAEDVAAAADISPRTFFNYFATKEDAFVGSDPGIAERLLTAVVERPAAETPSEAVRAVVAAHVATLESDTQLWRRRRELAAREPALALRLAGTTDAVERALVEAALTRSGADRATDLGPALAAHLAMAAVRAAVGQHVASGFEGSLSQRLTTAFAAVDAGAAGAAGAGGAAGDPVRDARSER
ncbi:TetR/AcrR family transcriptional regulator [Oryzobacter terrae]|uniref:TetR/AcrR family transcriptional regulator n=1 Tax=Oryzobacter terrae TaxID=1620385 RepID=UPI00366F64FE